MKKIILICLITVIALNSFGQTIDGTYLNPIGGDGISNNWIRFGNSTNYWSGFLWNINSSTFGNGNDFTIFTYDNRDLNLWTGNGNISLLPGTIGNVGIGTTTPNRKLTVFDATMPVISLGKNTSNVVELSYENDYGSLQSIISGVGGKLILNGSGGNVGIGTTRPSEKLEINGNIEIPSVNSYLKSSLFNYWGVSQSGYGYYGMCLRYKNDQWESFHASINGMAMKFIANGIEFVTAPPNNSPATITTLMRIKSDGSVSIDGKLTTKEVKVQLNVWSDFVFNDDYKLKKLDEVESYINNNNRLPDMPSEITVIENGINLGQMDAKLLQKIEELTLYMIDMNKRMNLIETENSELKDEIKELKSVQ